MISRNASREWPTNYLQATSNLKPYLSGRHVEYSGFREYVIENLGNCLRYTGIPNDTPRERRHMATCD